MSADPVLGMYRASVANNQDPLNEARVTLLIPQVLGNAESAWASPASPTNTIPPIGQTVWVQFSGGDITKPVYSPLGIKAVQDQVDNLPSGGALDVLPPKEPTALTLTTVQYVTDEGATQARVTASWTPPTENQDGTTLTDLSHYLLQTSYDDTNWGGGFVTTEDLLLLDGLNTGVTFYVRVAAIDTSNNASLWASASITTASASSPPPVPSAPGVVGVLGGLRVTWDGNDNTGTAMPAVFSHVQVQRDTDPAFSNPAVVGTLTGPDFLYDSVQNYANAYNYRLIAYSKVGIASTASAANSGTAHQAGTSDIAANSVTANQMQAGTITAQSGVIASIDASKITVGKVTATQIDATNLQVAAANVTGKLTATQIDATNLVISGGNVSGTVPSASSASSATTVTGSIGSGVSVPGTQVTGTVSSASSASSATTVTGSIGAGVSIPASQLNNSQIPTSTVISGNSIVTGNLDASKVSVSNLDASSIKAGTITLDKLNVGVANSVMQKFYDFGTDATKWVNSGGTGTMTSIAVTDSASGGSVMQCVGSIVGAYRPDVKIPFDPSVTYRVTVRVRQTVSDPGSQQTVFAGLMGWAYDGTTVVNKDGAASFSGQHYIAINGEFLATGGGWSTWTGYVRGTAATGTRQECPNGGIPGQMNSNVKYISPILYLNFSGGTGTAQMDMFTIEVVQPGSVRSTHMVPGTITSNLVPNPGFEQSGHWVGFVSGNGTAVPATGASARTGSGYFSLGAPAATDGAWVISDAFPVTAGQTYTLGVWATGTGVLTARIRTSSDAYTWTETQDQIESVPVAQTGALAGIYTLLSAQKTIPAGATWADVIIYNYQPSTPGTILVDDISVTQGAQGSGAGTGAADLSGNGIHVYDQYGNLTASINGGPDDFAQFAGGNATIASDGSISGTEVDSDTDVFIQGMPLLNDPTYGSFLTRAPGALNSPYPNNILDMMPRGIVAYTYVAQTYVITPTETGVLELSASLEPYRMYRIKIGGTRITGQSGSSVNQGTFGLGVRTTGIGGAAPTTASTLMNQAFQFVAPYGGNWYETTYEDILVTGSTSGVQRFLITAVLKNNPSGINYVSWGGAGYFYVEDIGPAISDTGVWLGSTGSTSGPTEGGLVNGGAPSQKKTYTTTWKFDWSGSYTGGGSYNSYYGNGINQGYYSSNNGNQKSMMGFAASTLSSISSALSGATINSCSVYLYANHWYYNSGGTALIGTHNISGSRPGSFTGTSARVTSTGWPNPGGRTVSLGTTIGGEFKSGVSKGIVLGPGNGNSWTYYGLFNGVGQSNPPSLTISYTK